MIKEFTIKGMTCSGCVASVTNHLKAIPSVTNAVIDLPSETAKVSLNADLSMDQLANGLPSKFTFEPKTFKLPIVDSTPSEASKLQLLKPLILILGYISIASVLMHYKNWSTTEFMLDFMGIFFIVFSFFKMLDLKGFPASFRMYDPLAKAIPFYAVVYPFIETGLGLMFLMRFQIPIALVVTLIILSITTIGVIRSLMSKKSIRCACLGTALKLPMTEATLIENGIMLVMVFWMLYSTLG